MLGLSLFVTLVLSACSISHTPLAINDPHDAFVFVRADAPVITFVICDEPKDDKKGQCTRVADSSGLHIASSGVVVADSIVHKGRQYIMTAGHSCEIEKRFRIGAKRWWKNEKKKDLKSVDMDIIVRVKTNNDESYIGKVIAINADRDLCILAIQGSNLPVAKLANSYPKRGGKIYNLAAPLGSWQPGVTHRFDGYYSGPYKCEDEDEKSWKCDEGDVVWSSYTVAATFGSSGSPIFDKKNRLIGILVMVRGGFHHVIKAVRLEDMKDLLDDVMKFEASPAGREWDGPVN